MTRCRLLAAVVALGTVVLVPSPARAAGVAVTSTADVGPGSLRAAIDAPFGDTITFDLHGCPCTITLTSGPLAVTRNLTVTGPGANQLVVSGNHASRVFEVAQGVTFTLSALTVADGDGTTGPLGGGGGIRSVGALDVRHVVFRDNTAGRVGPYGGAIESSGPILTVTESTFVGNRATFGGAIDNGGPGAVVISASTFTGNQAANGTGGAVNNNYFTAGPVTVVGSTFAGNQAGVGGAIFNGRTVTVVNSTFSANHATFLGGALTNESGGRASLTGVTMAANTTDRDGGAIYVATGTVTVTGSVISGTGQRNCVRELFGIKADGGHNLEFNPSNTCEFTKAAVSGDPKLGPLADNGGPTQTMALGAGSPAIRAGDPAVCAAAVDQGGLGGTDQRGLPRKQACDVGAFETAGVILAQPDAYAVGTGPLAVAAPGVLADDTSDYPPLTAVRATAPGHGTLDLHPDGSFVYTPQARYRGTDSFTYRAVNRAGQQSAPATVTLRVTPVNQPPVAVGDAATTTGVPATVAVTTNDTDPDGDPLTATVALPPSHGTATCSGRSCTYTPAGGFVGADSFTYTDSDGLATSPPARVTVTVASATAPTPLGPSTPSAPAPLRPQPAKPLPHTGTDVVRTTLLAIALVALGVDILAAARLLGPRTTLKP